MHHVSTDLTEEVSEVLAREYDTHLSIQFTIEKVSRVKMVCVLGLLNCIRINQGLEVNVDLIRLAHWVKKKNCETCRLGMHEFRSH